MEEQKLTLEEDDFRSAQTLTQEQYLQRWRRGCSHFFSHGCNQIAQEAAAYSSPDTPPELKSLDAFLRHHYPHTLNGVAAVPLSKSFRASTDYSISVASVRSTNWAEPRCRSPPANMDRIGAIHPFPQYPKPLHD